MLVAFFVYPRIKLLDLAGPLQVFEDAARCSERAYTTAVVGLEDGAVATDTALDIPVSHHGVLRRRPIHTLVVVGGPGAEAASEDPTTLDAVRRLGLRSGRTSSVCTGAFVLAACGLLDGRRAVTHWDSCSRLQSRYPDVRVEVDPIFVRDGSVWTSAGVTAGIDMALAMVADDGTRGDALRLAKSLVTYMARPGGQSQFSVPLQAQARDARGRFDDLHDWIRRNLTSDLRVERLARQSNMSPRNFSRVYLAETGASPARAVEAFRVESARRLLETTEMPISEVAARCGFNDDERLRRAMLRQVNTSPSRYRRRFLVTPT